MASAGKGRPLSDDEGDSTASTSAGRYKNDSDGDDVGPRVPKRARHEDDDDDDDEDGDDHRRGSAAPAAPAAKAATAAGPVKPADKLGRAGGMYIPPAKLAAMLKDVNDPNTKEYQRMTWEALKKSINGLINKINTSNIKNLVPELFGENLIRGRGLFARSSMKAQAAAPIFTSVYAAMIAVINTKIPANGELVLVRLITQFRKAYRRNDKAVCLSSSTFLAHLVNQRVVHEIVALQILTLMLERPTDDSVEIAVGFMREVGHYLSEVSSKATHAVFDRFRSILHDGQIDKRVQYMIEVLFQVRKDKFKDHPSIPPELDLVEEEEQITHNISLDDDLDVEELLDVFQFDPDYVANEAKYKEIKTEVLGDENENAADNEEEEDDEEAGAPEAGGNKAEEQMRIQDMTNTNLINLRRTIYLTIMSSAGFEEAVHKIMKLNTVPGQEKHFSMMILECCAQERTYVKSYGLVGQRLCQLNKTWQACFEELFEDRYTTIHRLDTNGLRNTAKFFSHLLSSDAISWAVMQIISLNENDTTASSRIFIKILFQEIVEFLGLEKTNKRLQDTTMKQYFANIMPKGNPRDTRFAINYFTSIGLGGLTDDLREHLKNAPKQIMNQRQADVSDSDSSSSSDSESDSDSDSDSDSSSSSGSDSSSSDSDSD